MDGKHYNETENMKRRAAGMTNDELRNALKTADNEVRDSQMRYNWTQVLREERRKRTFGTDIL